jgi:hypothetical protein
VTSRLRRATTLDTAKYATLVAEAIDAFGRDPMYAVQVAESARSMSSKKKRKTPKE